MPDLVFWLYKDAILGRCGVPDLFSFVASWSNYSKVNYSEVKLDILSGQTILKTNYPEVNWTFKWSNYSKVNYSEVKLDILSGQTILKSNWTFTNTKYDTMGNLGNI